MLNLSYYLICLSVSFTPSSACTVENGVAFIGGPSFDLQVLNSVASAAACCLDCRRVDGCIGYTFFSATFQCVMKHTLGGSTPNLGASSGVSTGVCAFDNGFEYPLFDMSTIGYIESKEMCCYWCTATIKCAGYTYFKSGPNAKECRMKYATDNAIPSPNMVSGSSIGGSCKFSEGIDFRGFDLTTVPKVPSKQDCCNKCNTTAKCTAFTYISSGPGARNCILKSSGVNRISNPNAVSATVSGLSCILPPLSPKPSPLPAGKSPHPPPPHPSPSRKLFPPPPPPPSPSKRLFPPPLRKSPPRSI